MSNAQTDINVVIDVVVFHRIVLKIGSRKIGVTSGRRHRRFNCWRLHWRIWDWVDVRGHQVLGKGRRSRGWQADGVGLRSITCRAEGPNLSPTSSAGSIWSIFGQSLGTSWSSNSVFKGISARLEWPNHLLGFGPELFWLVVAGRKTRKCKIGVWGWGGSVGCCRKIMSEFRFVSEEERLLGIAAALVIDWECNRLLRSGDRGLRPWSVSVKSECHFFRTFA